MNDIADLVPHAGPMCLLETVVAWDEAWIHCRSTTHRAANHPLCGDDGMPPVALIEYAAQATAAHGTLMSRHGNKPGHAAAPGRLAALKDVRIQASQADILAAPLLDVHAHQLLADPAGSIYTFHIQAGDIVALDGRLTVKTFDTLTD